MFVKDKSHYESSSTQIEVEDVLELKIQELVVDKFTAIVRESSERAATFKNDPDILKKGFWYANTHYQALKQIKALDILTVLREHDCFYEGLPPNGFTEVEDPDYLNGIRILSYRLKEGMKPSEALRSIRESLCYIDCQMAIEMAYYEVLLDLLGEDKFNDYFRFDGEHPLALDPDIFSTPLQDFIISTPCPLAEMRRGDQRYFANDPLYCSRHLHGEAQGYHTLCIQTNPELKFTAFGLSPDGLTEDELFDVCVEDFNQRPLGLNSIVTNELARKILEAALKNGYKNAIEQGRLKVLTKEALRETHQSTPILAGFHPHIIRLQAAVIRQLMVIK